MWQRGEFAHRVGRWVSLRGARSACNALKAASRDGGNVAIPRPRTTRAWRSRRAMPRARSAMRVARSARKHVAGAAAESRVLRRRHRRHPAAANDSGTQTGDIGMAFARAIPQAQSVMRIARRASKRVPVRPTKNRRFSRRRHRRHSAAANSACYAARVTGLPSRAASTVAAPACPDRARHVLSSNALVTTLTLENAIAAPAYIGSSMPSAASGMPIRL